MLEYAALPPAEPYSIFCSQADHTQKLLDPLLDLHALSHVVVDPLNVQGAQLLAVSVRDGIVGAQLLEGVNVAPERIRGLQGEKRNEF